MLDAWPELRELVASNGKRGSGKAGSGSSGSGGSGVRLMSVLRGEVSDWVIDFRKLALGDEIGSGASSQVFRGTYCGQDVAIKRLFSSRWDAKQVGVTLTAITTCCRHRRLLLNSLSTGNSPGLCIQVETFFVREVGLLCRLHHPNVVSEYA